MDEKEDEIWVIDSMKCWQPIEKLAPTELET
jgi:hypothetical protein